MFTVLLVGLVLFSPLVIALDNGLAMLPPRGWRSGERFGCLANCDDFDNCLSWRFFEIMADNLVSSGLVANGDGFNYVILDDCWSSVNRTKNGSITTDWRFYSLQNTIDYIHNQGLKVGLYADIGVKTRNGYPGSKFHMKQDADTFAFWGVDMVFLDARNSTLQEMETGFPAMAMELNRTSRPILVSCAWPKHVILQGNTPDYQKVSKYCNTWQNFPDIHDSWDSIKGVLEFYGNNDGGFLDVSGPGGWGNPGTMGDIEIWIRKISPGSLSRAFAIFNLASGGSPKLVTVQYSELGLIGPVYSVREVFSERYLGVVTPNNWLNVTVNPSGVYMGMALL